MNKHKMKLLCSLILAGFAAPQLAHATDGYFSHGYGMKSAGMGGASVAMAEDAFGGANNPASMVWAGSRMDVGVSWFRPIRGAERTGSNPAGMFPGALDFQTDSGSTDFAVPEFAYNRMLNSDLSFGVTVYGNGGMNTNYPGEQMSGISITPAMLPGLLSGLGMDMTQFTNLLSSLGITPPANLGTQGLAICKNTNAMCGDGRLGVDLMQLIIAPTVSWKFMPNQSIGASLLLGYQRFKAEGLQAFDQTSAYFPIFYQLSNGNSRSSMSDSPGNVTNRGYDSATGVGVRVGYMGRFGDSFSVGASYAPKMKMGKFDKYKGLFAEQGGFDIPEHYSVGFSVKPVQDVTVALDYERINYGGVKSVGNPSTNQAGLGADEGPGFGWQNINVYKVGVQYQATSALTLRAGYNYTDNPIQARDVTFNILAPGIVQKHATVGFTYALDKESELTMAYTHAFKNDVSGSSLFSPMLYRMMAPLAGTSDGGNEKIWMYEDSLGIAYSLKF